MRVNASVFQIGVLWTNSSNKAQPPGNGMAPADIDDVVVDLAAASLRELEKLESVNHADLIVTVHQMGVAALDRDLVAVNQTSIAGYRATGGVVKMSVTESACHSDR